MTRDAEKAIKVTAKQSSDFRLLGMVDEIDLVAKEAMYHKTCYRSYVRHYESMCDVRPLPECAGMDSLSLKKQIPSDTKDVRAAHNAAFEYLCEYVNDNIIALGTVERMTMLRNRYQMYMQDNSPEFFDPTLKTCSLKLRLITHFGDRIQFVNPPNNRGDLVYSSDLNLGDAVGVAFDATASETRILADAAHILRRDILNSQKKSPSMEWPPSDSFLQSGAISPPPSLVDFLSRVVSGKSQTANLSDRVVRLSTSFAEDICSAATASKWKMPKHLLLGIAVHHLTGSAEMLTILNRFGHCTNYSAVLELETAMANAVMLQDSILPSNISVTNNKFSHTCWDNFDILEETPSGSGTTHTTHGIIIQELCDPSLSSTSTVQAENTFKNASRSRSLKYSEKGIADYICKKRVEPSSVTCTNAQCVDQELLQQSRLQECVWTVCRSLANAAMTVPEWSGWVSQMSTVQTAALSCIGYMTPIFQPITDYATVRECLVRSLKASAELQQRFTFVTMDLAAARIAYDVIFESAGGSRSDLSNVIIHIGPFHTMCAYMGAIGHMIAGSGFEEIVIESGVCASGSIDRVMSGKHYNRALRVHQRVLEALERLMIAEFFKLKKTSPNSLENSELKELASSPSCQSFNDFAGTAECTEFVEAYSQFKDDIRQGKLGLTAKFWITYCDTVWNLLQFQRSVKENDINQYIASLRQMASLLFSSDRVNYAKYLPLYYVQLTTLETSHPGATEFLKNDGFTVSRSAVPSCRNAVDITIEQTINRSAKTRGGIVGFSRNTSAYYRWCLTRHCRATYLEATLDRADMTSNSHDSHKSIRPSQVRRSESEVQNIQAAFQQFSSPLSYKDDGDVLYCLSSGRPASDAVSRDLMRYTQVGETAAQEFIQTRLVDKTVPFHSPVKKQMLQTFMAMAVTKSVVSKHKTIQVKKERNLLGSIFLLSQKHDIDLERLFSYPLSPVPWSLGTADGALMKTNKSQLMKYLEAKVAPAENVDSVADDVAVIDGNAVFQSITSPPSTFADLASHIFHTRLPKSRVIHFVTDTYHRYSIKEMERQRRGSSTCYKICGPKTRVPHDWKGFLRNSDNKTELTNVILNEWQSDQYAKHLHDRQLFFVNGSYCYCLSTVDGRTTTSQEIPQLFSTQEEADTRIILHCLFETQRRSSDSTVAVRSPDTDVLVLLIAYATQIPNKLYFDTGVGNKRRRIDVHAIEAVLGERLSAALPGFHSFTGCDSISAFVRRGKTKPFKLLETCAPSQEYLCVFESLGRTSRNPVMKTFGDCNTSPATCMEEQVTRTSTKPDVTYLEAGMLHKPTGSPLLSRMESILAYCHNV